MITRETIAELLVARHGIKDGVPERERIMELAKNLLRYEVTWRQKELQRLQLEYADQWDLNRVVEVMTKRLDQLALQGKIMNLPMEAEHDDLHMNKRDQAYYRLWLGGADLRVAKYYVPVRKARNSLKQRGIDIFRPVGDTVSIDLGELLSVERAKFSRPKGFASRC